MDVAARGIPALNVQCLTFFAYGIAPLIGFFPVPGLGESVGCGVLRGMAAISGSNGRGETGTAVAIGRLRLTDGIDGNCSESAMP